jgi:hypothetical protein
MAIERVDKSGARVTEQYRISLALSGGGFRAAIFHLGVIRRLEERGIMKDVDVISAVSGGSIIAAYYVCEMEKRLRQLEPSSWSDTPTRVAIFEAIAKDFMKGVDHNLRTRALIFTPFFHPILFVKTLIRKIYRAGARAEGFVFIRRDGERRTLMLPPRGGATQTTCSTSRNLTRSNRTDHSIGRRPFE